MFLKLVSIARAILWKIRRVPVRFTQADAGGVRRFLEGDYVARFGVRETADKGGGFAEVRFSVQA